MGATRHGDEAAIRGSAAALIREARIRADLTQVELAAKAGVTQSVISTYENGRREPSFAVLQRLFVAAGFEGRLALSPLPPQVDLRDRVGRNRDEIRRMFAVLGGRNVRLFGSVARGDHRPDSDVDLMVDLDRGKGLFALMQMQDGAERLLDAPVDVVSAEGLAAGRRVAAMRDAVDL